MAKQVWTVRVINPRIDEHARPTSEDRWRLSVALPGLWVEQLRSLGLVRVLDDTQENRQVLEFRPPAGTALTHVWAEQEAARMISFGINAAAAPEWRD